MSRLKEWCGCGAGISGKPKQVQAWRKHHRHPDPQPSDHPPTSGGSQVENIWPSIGFRADPEVHA